jgi:alpha-amylase/alpha-mannosidase (GH57 family)
MDWAELRYRPHIARHGDDEIIVVVRDRDLSNAQESGMELDWFLREVEARTRWCGFPPLVTTCTDGENGGWFRNTTPGANFWSAFYQPFLQRARAHEDVVRPIFISEYLDRFGAHGEVRVQTGAWNTGWHHGRGFTQWTGSWRQQQVLDRIRELSEAVHDTRWRATALGAESGPVQGHLEQALWRLLRAETSCNIYWGEAWVDRAERDLDESARALAQAKAGLETESEDVGC